VRARRRPLRQEDDELLIDERPQGEFSRQLFLGDNLDTGRMQANFELGVLTLTIPVSEASKPRKVEIASGSSERQTIETSSTQTAGEQSSAETAHARS
jgi:HSP20 family protein